MLLEADPSKHNPPSAALDGLEKSKGSAPFAGPDPARRRQCNGSPPTAIHVLLRLETVARSRATVGHAAQEKPSARPGWKSDKSKDLAGELSLNQCTGAGLVSAGEKGRAGCFDLSRDPRPVSAPREGVG